MDAHSSEGGARTVIEAQLREAGWTIEGDGRDGVALAEVQGPDGRVSDFLLYVDGSPVGAIETKGAQRALGSAEWNQLLRSAASADLPFHYLATGAETLFLNLRDPDPQPRSLRAFHRPETLRRWLRDSPLRSRLRELPNAPLSPLGLAPHQQGIVEQLEASLAQGRSRSLLVLTTGIGKTRVVVAEIHRLLDHARVGRILYLVDRRESALQLLESLRRETFGEEGPLSERFRAVLLEGEDVPPDARIIIATAQRLTRLLGEGTGASYRSSLPPEAFDVIVVDDADRIVRDAKWVLDYFDAVVVGIAVTPSAAGYHYFQGNAVSVVAPERAPDVVSRLIALAVGDRRVRRAIDPWVGWGGVLRDVRAAVEIEDAVAIAPSPTGLPLDETPVDITWSFGDPLEVLPRTAGEFDLIVNTPPFTTRSRRHELRSGETVLEVRDAAEWIVMLEAASRLSAEGEAYVLVPNGFFWHAGQTAWREMHKLGIYPSAVIGMPMRSNVPVPSTIATSLLILSREKHERLFIAQITGDDEYDLDTLIHNLRARESGEVRELGRLVDPATFTGVHRAFEEERVAVWAARADLQPRTLGDISTEINFLAANDEGFEEQANAVYVALMGAPKNGAATSQDGLGAKPSSCVQIVLDPDLAVAEYVAAFLNSERGRSLRASWSVGTIQRIQRGGIRNKVVYLPDLDRQEEAAALMKTARTLRARLTEIEGALADGTADIAEVRSELAAVHDENAWIEGLPFPLSSILWKYASELDARERLEHLLHFFEAAAMFAVTLLLSGFETDSSFFSDHRSEWVRDVRGIKKASWGTWTKLHSRLAKTASSMLETEESRAQCLELFKTTRPSVIEAFSSSEFEAVINEAREFRNRRDAHGPYSDDRERKRMVEVLEGLLQRFQEEVAGAFRGFQMVRPLENRYRNGAYYYNAHSLMGSRREFREVEVTTTAPMEEGDIYLLDLDATTPLRLMPLVQVRPGPATEEDACYFYSALEDGGARLISYHFGGEAEINVQDTALESTIEMLAAKG